MPRVNIRMRERTLFSGYGYDRYRVSIRRRQGFGLLDGHLLVAAQGMTFAGFCTENLCPADLAAVSFSQLTHVMYLQQMLKKTFP